MKNQQKKMLLTLTLLVPVFVSLLQRSNPSLLICSTIEYGGQLESVVVQLYAHLGHAL